MVFKILFSLTFAILVVVYTFFPIIKIDTTTIILVLMVFVPWIVHYLKSIEINGIGKVELITKSEKEELENSAEKININNIERIRNRYISIEDPKLSLAALRIDIEERLNKIAQQNHINKYSRGIIQLSNQLYETSLIDSNEYAIIRDIIGILNKAVHSDLNAYAINSYNNIINIGVKLIGSLERKIEENQIND